MTAPSVFPFFVGCERSGTTLLRLMLDSHPALAVPGESYFVPRLWWGRERYEGTDGAFDADLLAGDLLAHEWFAQWSLPSRDVRDALASPPVPDFAEAMRRVYALYAAREGKPRYGDKTPDYVRQIPVLSALFPESRFVHVIRDGRDVAMSRIDVGLADTGYPASALYWRSRVRLGRYGGRQVGPGRYLEIRYEALIDDPEQVLRGVCDFIELPFDDAMLRYTDRASRIVEGMDDARHVHSVMPPTKGLRDWRTQMSPHDLMVTELLAGDALWDLGYEPSGLKPSLSARAEAGRIQAGDLARRARARLRSA